MVDREAFDDAVRAISSSYARKSSLCAPFLSVLPVKGVAISVLGSRVGQATICSSDRQAARIDELQFDLGEGPCWQAVETRRPVLTEDLTTGQHPRWPTFAHALAGRHEVGALFAFPLAVGSLGIGAVDLYMEDPGQLDDAQVADASTLAGIAAWQVLRRILAYRDSETDPSLDREGAGSSRREFHQATGMVLAQTQTSADDAAVLIRAHSFVHGQTVAEVSHEIVSRRLVFSPEMK